MQNAADDSAQPETTETLDRSGALRPRLSFGLALPFAIVGAAGGWLSAGFLSNPIVRVTVGDDRALAAVCAGSVAALLGAALTRWCVGSERGRAVIWARLAGAVLIGGAVSGGAVGVLSVATPFAVATGALNGLISSVAFLPVCALVLAAARRAERARMGSIVAGADRRAVWAILAAAIAVTTLAALPDWPVSIDRLVLGEPIAAIAICGAAAAVVLGALVADAIAIARISRAASDPDLEERDPDDARKRAHLPRLDLGLGDDVRARLAQGASAYRSADRAVALIVGSPDRARSALRRASLRGLASAALVGGVLAAHASAASTLGSFHHARLMCDRGDTSSCRTAAILAQIRAASPADAARAVELHKRACEGDQLLSCVELARIYETGEGVPASPEATRTYRLHACVKGHVGSCRSAFNILIHRERLVNELPVATAMMSRACRLGDGESCTVAAYLDEVASTGRELSSEEIACISGQAAACETAAARDTQELRHREARLLRERGEDLAKARGAVARR